MNTILIGTEAVANRVVTSHELRRRHRPAFPNVHAPADVEPPFGWQVVGVVNDEDSVDVIHTLHGAEESRDWRGRIGSQFRRIK